MINKLKKSKAGFTLVELIVVIAIIGVLAAVLAPQYIKYVESSRVAVDDNAGEELRHTVEVVLAEGKVYDEVSSTLVKDGNTLTVTFSDSTTLTFSYTAAGTDVGAAPNDSTGELAKAIKATITKGPDFKSNAHNGGTYKVVITRNANNGFAVTGGF